jgi:hypothetical protein
VEEDGSSALFFLHLVLRFWNHTCGEDSGSHASPGRLHSALPFVGKIKGSIIED